MASEQNAFSRFVTRHRKGDVLFREGDPGDKLFIVQAGSVAIKKATERGVVQLAVMQKGDFFGEMAVLEHQPRSATAEMVEDGALVAIDSTTFASMVRSNPEIAVRMLRKYSRRLREMNALLARMGVEPSPSRDVIAEAPTARPTPIEPIVPLAAPPVPPAVPDPAAAEPEPAKPAVVTEPAFAMAPVAAVTSEVPAMDVAEPAPLAFLVAKTSGNRYPITKADALVGRFDSVSGRGPDIDVSREENSRNVSRRHARVLHKTGQFFLVEENGAMNGTFVNGQRVTSGAQTPLTDGDEIMLCRVPLTFKLS